MLHRLICDMCWVFFIPLLPKHLEHKFEQMPVRKMNQPCTQAEHKKNRTTCPVAAPKHARLRAWNGMGGFFLADTEEKKKTMQGHFSQYAQGETLEEKYKKNKEEFLYKKEASEEARRTCVFFPLLLPSHIFLGH